MNYYLVGASLFYAAGGSPQMHGSAPL